MVRRSVTDSIFTFVAFRPTVALCLAPQEALSLGVVRKRERLSIAIERTKFLFFRYISAKLFFSHTLKPEWEFGTSLAVISFKIQIFTYAMS
jgi:hypothetical protein